VGCQLLARAPVGCQLLARASVGCQLLARTPAQQLPLGWLQVDAALQAAQVPDQLTLVTRAMAR